MNNRPLWPELLCSCSSQDPVSIWYAGSIHTNVNEGNRHANECCWRSVHCCQIHILFKQKPARCVMFKCSFTDTSHASYYQLHYKNTQVSALTLTGSGDIWVEINIVKIKVVHLTHGFYCVMNTSESDCRSGLAIEKASSATQRQTWNNSRSILTGSLVSCVVKDRGAHKSLLQSHRHGNIPNDCMISLGSPLEVDETKHTCVSKSVVLHVIDQQRLCLHTRPPASWSGALSQWLMQDRQQITSYKDWEWSSVVSITCGLHNDTMQIAAGLSFR